MVITQEDEKEQAELRRRFEELMKKEESGELSASDFECACGLCAHGWED